MSLTESELVRLLEDERPALAAWGQLVVNVVESALESQLGSRKAVEEFLKLQVRPRVKDAGSLVRKAFYRGKNYEEPHRDITDRVGVRFVVLLLKDIDRIKTIIEGHTDWQWSLDRDFEAERKARPYEFNYQAVHYIVRPRQDVMSGSVRIPAGLPCEVQVKTLLQHAYSELTHDLVYKPAARTTPEIQHAAAKSMALIETADDIFRDASRVFEEARKRHVVCQQLLAQAYERVTGIPAPGDVRLDTMLIEELSEITGIMTLNRLETFLAAHGFLGARVTAKMSVDRLYQQSVILLLLLLVSEKPNALRHAWPLQASLLQSVYADMGQPWDEPCD